MRIRWIVPLAAVAALAAYAWAQTPDTSAVQRPAPEPAKALGKIENAKWTPTTIEAATSEANKEMLEKGEAKTVTGEVVDVSCYLQLGKTGQAHVDCGSKCIRAGQPVGILSEDGELYLLMAEEHHPRRDGMTDLNKVFLPLLAKTVTVSGMETEVKGYNALFVSAAELGAMKKAGAKAKTSGTKTGATKGTY